MFDTSDRGQAIAVGAGEAGGERSKIRSVSSNCSNLTEYRYISISVKYLQCKHSAVSYQLLALDSQNKLQLQEFGFGRGSS